MLRASLLAFSSLVSAAGAQTIQSVPTAPGVLRPGDKPTDDQWMSLSPALAAKANAVNGTLTSPPIVGGLNINGPLLWLSSSPTQNTTYAAGGLTNGVIIAAGGNMISFCPPLSCVTSPSTDHQRAGALFWGTTSDDGHSQEQTVAIITSIETGYAKPWAPGASFSVGDNIQFSAANTVYRATVAGTSASSGTGPVGKGSDIVDGTVHWAWINDQAINAKTGLYVETNVKPGAGQAWSGAVNYRMGPGVVPSFNVGLEIDHTNDAAECVLGTANCNNLELSIGGGYRSTQGLHLSSPNTGSYATHWGIRLNTPFLASDADIEIDSAAAEGISFNGSGLATTSHSIADIGVHTTSQQSILVTGTHSAQSYADTATTPAAFNLAGTYSLAAINTSVATTLISLTAKDRQKICFNGTDACFVHDAEAGKLYYQVGGVSIFSIADTTGNAVFKGSVTPNGSP